jgi:transposase
MSNQNNHKRPKYTIEFKQDAAKLVNEKGYTHKQAADNLGVSLSAIGRWVRAEQKPTTASATKKKVLNLTDQDELTHLRKEVECNGQLKQDTFLNSFLIEFPLKFQRGLVA